MLALAKLVFHITCAVTERVVKPALMPELMLRPLLLSRVPFDLMVAPAVSAVPLVVVDVLVVDVVVLLVVLTDEVVVVVSVLLVVVVVVGSSRYFANAEAFQSPEFIEPGSARPRAKARKSHTTHFSSIDMHHRSCCNPCERTAKVSDNTGFAVLAGWDRCHTAPVLLVLFITYLPSLPGIPLISSVVHNC